LEANLNAEERERERERENRRIKARLARRKRECRNDNYLFEAIVFSCPVPTLS